MDMLHHSGVEPKVMSLETLKEITNNFSIDRELGSGTFGIVYKGVQGGEEIAVKQLHTLGHDDQKEFMKEFDNLWRLRHPNIVQLLGYCYEIKREVVALGDGRYVWADNIYRALCFEYMHNGSLSNHLDDEYHGHDWQTRYKIIKGICEGIKYLHEGLEPPMYHLDLKPDNILLDKNMVPKLADFGLSKLVHNNRTQATQSYIGTRGYLPPEYIDSNLISNKLDIFSLGVVIIRIITGFKGYHKIFEMSSQEFIELVSANWRNRLQGTLGRTSLEAECHQVNRSIEIALDCIHADRKKRPTIGDVVCRLNELEHEIDMSAAPSQLQISAAERPRDSSSEIHAPTSSKLLDIHPLELGLPFEPYTGHGAQNDGCEEPNKILHDVDGVYQSRRGAEQGHATVSGFSDSHTTKQLWGSSMPDLVSQIQKLQVNAVQKELNVPQQLQSMSGKMAAFPAAAPEEDVPMSSVVFNLPKPDNFRDDRSGNGMQVQGNSTSKGRRATNAKENNGGGGGVHNNNGGGQIGSSGQPRNALGRGAAVGDVPLPGMPPPAPGLMMPNTMMGGAGFTGMYQTGGGSMDHPRNGSLQQQGSGSGGASHPQGMPAGGMPATGSYQGGADAGRSMPSGPEMRQPAMNAGNLTAAQQEYLTLMQLLGMPSGLETVLTANARGDQLLQQYYTALVQQRQQDSLCWPEMLWTAITAGNLSAPQQWMAFMQQRQQGMSSTLPEVLQAAMASRNQTAEQYSAVLQQQRQRSMSSWTEVLLDAMMMSSNQKAEQYKAIMQQQQGDMSWPGTLLAAMAPMNQGSEIQAEKNISPNRNG